MSVCPRFGVTSIFNSLQLSLWGNKCDLSISAGKDNSQTSNPLKQIGTLDEFLLVDDFDRLWNQLLVLREKTKQSRSTQLDLVLDNAGNLSLVVYFSPLKVCEEFLKNSSRILKSLRSLKSSQIVKSSSIIPMLSNLRAGNRRLPKLCWQRCR